MGQVLWCQPMDSDRLYFQLRQLAETAPSLADPSAVTPEERRWLGRVAALIEGFMPAADITSFKVACDGIGSVMHKINAPTVLSIFHRALAKAELAAPAAAQGQFLAAGDTFSAMAQVGKVFSRATENLMIVDKYADVVLLTDFVVNAPAAVQVRVLGGEGEPRRAALTPAVSRWNQQFAGARLLEVRLAPGQHLHDRIIVIDGKECWVSGQSFNGMAVRSPTYLSKLDAELAEQKVAAYSDIWHAAKSI